MARRKKEETQSSIQEAASTIPITETAAASKPVENIHESGIKKWEREENNLCEKEISFIERLQLLTVTELLDYERLARIVCSRIESEMKNYDGTIKPGSDYAAFHSYTATYRAIVNEMERRLKGCRD